MSFQHHSGLDCQYNLSAGVTGELGRASPPSPLVHRSAQAAMFYSMTQMTFIGAALGETVDRPYAPERGAGTQRTTAYPG